MNQLNKASTWVLAHEPSSLGQCIKELLPEATYTLSAETIAQKVKLDEVEAIIIDMEIDHADELIKSVKLDKTHFSIPMMGLASERLNRSGPFVFPDHFVLPPHNRESIGSQLSRLHSLTCRHCQWTHPAKHEETSSSLKILVKLLAQTTLSSIDRSAFVAAVSIGLGNACDHIESQNPIINVAYQINHGHLGKSSALQVSIEDSGSGFDIKPYLLDRTRFNNDGRYIGHKHHHGLLTMQSCVDTIHYNQKEHILTLEKNLNPGRSDDTNTYN